MGNLTQLFMGRFEVFCHGPVFRQDSVYSVAQ